MVDQSGPDDLLLSDDERLYALNVLSEHYADGRLDVNEFYDRSAVVASARSLTAVRAPFEGLPGGVPLGIVDGRIRKSQELATRSDAPMPQTGERSAAESELASLRRRGNLVETLDWIIIGVTLVTFLVLQFVFDVSYAWVVWPTLILTLSVPRMIFDFTDSDEEALEELKEADAAARKKRLKQAAERMRQLEEKNPD
ncbi:MAG: DUF1707 domain-containing protein [Rhodococcus sp.]|nr:DUF1707 domain-containing protein [Rhodococcus sp. (in: high G+C Gram-positive bacteria)]